LEGSVKKIAVPAVPICLCANTFDWMIFAACSKLASRIVRPTYQFHVKPTSLTDRRFSPNATTLLLDKILDKVESQA
jgi:hypothetical protein